MTIFKGYRTILLTTLAALLPILELTEWRDIVPDIYWPYYCIGVSALGVGLRLITTTPVGKK